MSENKSEHENEENGAYSCEALLTDKLELENTSIQNVDLSTFSNDSILQRMCFIASFEPPFEIPDDMSIQLPPRRLLLMVLPQFFAQVDYSTDIFVKRNLFANVEKVYSRSSSPANDAWAISFYIIILIVFGSEKMTKANDSLISSQFSFPFLHAIRAALHWAPFLTTSKLINVQALALLVS